MATTTSTIVLIYLEGSNSGQLAIKVKSLKAPEGLLGGIGRRVSSLFWGNTSGALDHGESNKLVQVLGYPKGENDPEEQVVCVLTSNTLQKWLVVKDEPETLFYSCNVESLAKEAFAHSSAWVSF